MRVGLITITAFFAAVLMPACGFASNGNGSTESKCLSHLRINAGQ